MHLDKTYLWSGGEYDLERLLTATDITNEVEKVQPLAQAKVTELLEIIEADVLPTPPGDVKCGSPYPCAFMDFCTFVEDGPEHPIRELPYCDPSKKIYQELEAAGPSMATK